MRRVLACLIALASPAAAQEDVTVFAAASLATAMDAVAEGFAAETGHRAVVSLAGSSALARQIEAGAPADVFVSANAAWMDRLEGAGLIAQETRRDLLSNALVLVAHDPGAVPVDLSGDLVAQLDGSRLAMALVEAVPAGIYGKAALESLGAWAGLEPQVVQADNVRAALALVAVGAAPYGIVYATDAVAEPRVSVVARFDPASHPPITYPVAAIGAPSAATQAFLRYLQGAAAREAFLAQGFTVLAD